MSKERWEWYQKEIQRLRELDKLLANKARATYSITDKQSIAIACEFFKQTMAKKKKLKVGDIVVAVFLGNPGECEVIEVTDKQLYKLRMKSGTILPGVTWYKLLDSKQKKNKPWYIVKYVRHTNSKVPKKDNIQKADLEKVIQKQKDFLDGNIEK